MRGLPEEADCSFGEKRFGKQRVNQVESGGDNGEKGAIVSCGEETDMVGFSV